MNELALFAGAGGGILGSKLLGWNTVCAVEIEPYCREVLLRRQRDGLLPMFPIWDDVRTFDGKPWRGKVDIVTAGFPCQPFSCGGKRLGEIDERNLWPETIRAIREVAPRVAFLENVPALRFPDRKGAKTKEAYFGKVVSDLAESGYVCRWGLLSAASVGARHLRERLWIVANATSDTPGAGFQCTESPRCGRGQPCNCGCKGGNGTDAGSNGRREGRALNGEDDGHQPGSVCQNLPYPMLSGLQIGEESQKPGPGRSAGGATWWEAEPAVGRLVDGLAHRVDRIRALGNGQVPAVVRAAWLLLSSN